MQNVIGASIYDPRFHTEISIAEAIVAGTSLKTAKSVA